jgi:signal transduction histidine kinase
VAAPLTRSATPPAGPGPPPAPAQGDDKVNILLVDDQPARLLTYQSVLASLGQNLVPARSGLEALEKLMHQEFAVVLLDVSMPEMDGFEAARLIHEHPRFERIPIIFVTGVHVSELDRLKGYEAGAVDYVSIPVVPAILRSKVAVLVELYQKRRELRELNRVLALSNERLARDNQTLNATLARANDELARANRSLQNEVAERARAELALREADRNKDDFLAMLAHELRNPLAPIRNAVQLLRMNVNEQQRTWSRDVIDRQVSHLTRLVDDLLDVSRITRGKINLTREPVAIGTVVARAVETVQPLVEEREQTLTIEVPPAPIVVDGDPMRLAQALGNVLGNAAKYTPRAGRIAVRVERSGAQVSIRVRDNGIGIPIERLPFIFGLFTQLEGPVNHPGSGLGIGLALVRRLVEMHGGTVSAHSEGSGRGSEFVILLPIHAEAASSGAAGRNESTPVAGADEAAEAAGADAAVATVPPIRIVVADDNPDALASLIELLRLCGHEVFGAADGREALESAERHRPDVALLDVGMPLLDGYEVARRIRAQPWGRQMALLALTGWGQDSDRRRSAAAGFNLHLVKPVDIGRLMEQLAQVQTDRHGAVDRSERDCN